MTLQVGAGDCLLDAGDGEARWFADSLLTYKPPATKELAVWR